LRVRVPKALKRVATTALPQTAADSALASSFAF
ncbi:hypothetical protein THAOC_24093, partial [Thalassiosira oceanica]